MQRPITDLLPININITNFDAVLNNDIEFRDVVASKGNEFNCNAKSNSIENDGFKRVANKLKLKRRNDTVNSSNDNRASLKIAKHAANNRFQVLISNINNTLNEIKLNDNAKNENENNNLIKSAINK